MENSIAKNPLMESIYTLFEKQKFKIMNYFLLKQNKVSLAVVGFFVEEKFDHVL